ncbi:ABC transporter transmembrane domain-containing protein [Candidatus Liberibacter asiaticus]|nr:ABC transporter transmembrane domain-containing protein [Candidatus Liberibacter asiaticus]KAE9510586.1 putative multidrug export ATP-binding/permease protein [Candidatus Liberibacter asiaticus]KAE9511698.1 putative multidrug export ATP-binding/permease protein [Candidatus Liberibacter asiaticus]KAE9512719.1 putative multidrug export ATP-binding/permease protein [Candidatus Liberibacter asiaticus]KAE9513740.1 putative multidrug export ATP-binding/permease protein [Candidatus Liberibacter asi
MVNKITHKNLNENISLFKFQILYLRHCWWFLTGELCAILLYSGITLLIPVMTSVLLDKRGVSPLMTSVFLDKRDVSLYLWGMFVLLLLAVASSLRYYCATMLGERMILFMQRDVIAKIIKLSPSFFNSRGHGEIFSILVKDTERIKAIIGIGMSIVLRSLLMGFGAMCMMFVISIKLSLIVVSIVTLFLMVMIKFSRKKTNTLYADEKKLLNIFSDMIKSVMVLQSFNAGKEAIRLYDIQSQKTYKGFLRSALIRTCIACFVIFFVSCGIFIVFLIGAHYVATAEMPRGKLAEFVVYAFIFFASIRSCLGFIGGISQAIASLRRLRELIVCKLDISSPISSRTFPSPVLGSVSFRSVSFVYPGKSKRSILKNVNFTVQPGETIALVGDSGAGKTSIFSLILRFYDPCSGSVEIEGIDLRLLSLEEIRRFIAWVPQHPIMIAASVYDNIAIGCPHATRKEIQNAAMLAQAHEFIGCLENGYDTILGDGAVHLSTGQIQRIAIARAILKDSPILLLDEMGSALDIENEQKIWKVLREQRRGRTTIFASHRLSAIQDADMVFVLHDQVIVEKGVHEELLKKSGFYAHYHILGMSQ